MASGDFVVSSTMAGSLTQTNGYWSSTPNYGNNTSTMSVSFYVTKRSGFSGTFGTGTWGIIVDGVDYQTTYNISVPTNSTVLVHSVSGIVITHDPNGTRSVGISIYGSIPSTSWTSTSGSTTAVLEDLIPNPAFTDSTINSTAIRGVAYSDGVVASNAVSYSVVSGALPAGITLNTTTGAITGTPTVLGVSSFVIRATNGSGTADTPSLSLTVNPPTPIFSDATVSSQGIVGTAYSDDVLASDAASYSVFSGALPNGLNLNTSTGAITGTPTAPGVFNFVITATNVTGTIETGTLTITVISGAKLWNGTAFVSGTTKVWNGTEFVSSTTKVWNGSDWVSAS